MNTLSHRGYTARIEFDERDNLFVGRILGIRSIISFHGETVQELRSAFEHAVVDYLDDCEARGLTKQKAAVDLWLKDIAPSAELRKWFGHEAAKWPEFQQRYRAELKGNAALAELKSLVAQGKVTLVYGAKDEQHNDAVVLQQLLGRGG